MVGQLERFTRNLPKNQNFKKDLIKDFVRISEFSKKKFKDENKGAEMKKNENEKKFEICRFINS